LHHARTERPLTKIHVPGFSGHACSSRQFYRKLDSTLKCMKTKRKVPLPQKGKKQVDQHHAWKAEAYQDQPCNTNSKKVDEQGNLIRPKFLSNYTHHSPTDPDARISVKPGKARQLNYFGKWPWMMPTISSQVHVPSHRDIIKQRIIDFSKACSGLFLKLSV
jgi:hypothetical protein